MSTEPKTAFSPADWTEEDTRRSKRIWEEYQSRHDLSEKKGQAAGIDPKTGKVWLGESALEIVAKRDAEGLDSQLFFVRVGYPTYLRKGGRR